ncbi:MAG: T9SS type A sorting domain-containing protein [Bacteroidales bacterium]|nr:T9SS type A sorting domain-containing protein [Bacteroidales bacterium]
MAEVTGIEPGINEISDISSQIKVYPNPVTDLFSIDFNLNKRKKIEIYIIDINGKLVRLLYKDTANKGKSTITFNKEALNPGTYFIIIKTNQKNISNEKIIISH